VIGDVSPFCSARLLVAYLGLNALHQSGSGPQPRGVSKQGLAPRTSRFVAAAWSMIRQPGPLGAFYERIRARHAHQVADAPSSLAILVLARARRVLLWMSPFCAARPVTAHLGTVPLARTEGLLTDLARFPKRT
jgi:transposase